MSRKVNDRDETMTDGTYIFNPEMNVKEPSQVEQQDHMDEIRTYVQEELEKFPVYLFAQEYAAQCGDPINKHIQRKQFTFADIHPTSAEEINQAAADAARRFVYRFCVKNVEVKPLQTLSVAQAETSTTSSEPTASPPPPPTQGANAAESEDEDTDAAESEDEEEDDGAMTDQPAEDEEEDDGAMTDQPTVAQSGGESKSDGPKPFADVKTAVEFADFLYKNRTTKLYAANDSILTPQREAYEKGAPIDLSQIVLETDNTFYEQINPTYLRKKKEFQRLLTKDKARSIVDVMVEWDLHKHLRFVLAPATANALQLAWGQIITRCTLQQCLDDSTARLMLADFAALRRRRKHYVAQHTQRRIDYDTFATKSRLQKYLQRMPKRKYSTLELQRRWDQANGR